MKTGIRTDESLSVLSLRAFASGNIINSQLSKMLTTLLELASEIGEEEMGVWKVEIHGPASGEKCPTLQKCRWF